MTGSSCGRTVTESWGSRRAGGRADDRRALWLGHAYGVWEADRDEPIYLITSLTNVDVAVEWYHLRFRIECMFANYKAISRRLNAWRSC